MSKSDPNFGVVNHAAGHAQRGRGLNPDRARDLRAPQFLSLLAARPARVPVVR